MIHLDFVRRNIRRAPYQALTASMAMFFAFLVFSIFTLLAIGTHKSLVFFENKPQLVAILKEGTTEQDINAITTALQATGKISKIDYITKEQAFERYKAMNQDVPGAVDLVTPNFLPASLEISATKPLYLKEVREMLRKEPVVGEQGTLLSEDAIDRLSKITEGLRWAGSIVVAFLGLFACLVVLMVVGFKLRLRRSEIETMKLLGASAWFIRLPFILEGMIYGLAGAIAAWICTYFIAWYATPYVSDYFQDLQLLPVPPVFMLLLLALNLGLAIIIGAFASFGAVRRYMKV